MLQPELRSRLNGLYMAWVFGCGAVASGVAVAVYQVAGWSALSCLGAAFAAAGLLYYATEGTQPRAFAPADRGGCGSPLITKLSLSESVSKRSIA